jgi:hypothetical protein
VPRQWVSRRRVVAGVRGCGDTHACAVCRPAKSSRVSCIVNAIACGLSGTSPRYDIDRISSPFRTRVLGLGRACTHPAARVSAPCVRPASPHLLSDPLWGWTPTPQGWILRSCGAAGGFGGASDTSARHATPRYNEPSKP